jgi:O-antigen/teichoic acid export membrane protein
MIERRSNPNHLREGSPIVPWRRPRAQHTATRQGTRGFVGANAMQLLRLISSLLIFALFTKRIGAEGTKLYAIYAAVQGQLGVLMMFFLSANVRVMEQQIVRDNQRPERALANCLARVVFGLSATVLFGLVIKILMVPQISMGVYLLLMAPELCAVLLIEFPAGYAVAVRGFQAGLSTRVIGASARVLGVGIAVVVGVRTLGGFGLVLLLTMLPIGLYACVTKLSEIGVRLSLGRVTLPELRTGSGYAATSVATSIQEDGDKTLMIRYETELVAGRYAISYRILQIAMIPLTALWFATHRNFLIDSGRTRNEHLLRAIKYSIPAQAYSIVVGFALVFGGGLIETVIGVDGSGEICQWLGLILPIRATTELALNALVGLKRTGFRAGVMVTTAATNIIANIWLIPLYSWKGAVLSTAIADGFAVLAAWGMLVYFQGHRNKQMRRPRRVTRENAEPAT